MICISCRNNRHEHCDNFYDYRGRARDELVSKWCDCQHLEGVYLDQTLCPHFQYNFESDLDNCPSCGKDMTFIEGSDGQRTGDGSVT